MDTYTIVVMATIYLSIGIFFSLGFLIYEIIRIPNWRNHMAPFRSILWRVLIGILAWPVVVGIIIGERY